MLEITRGPDIGGSEERELNSRRQHADNVIRRTVERDGLAQDVWVAAKTAVPQRVTDDDDRLAGGLSFFRQEEAAHLRRNAKHLKEIRGNTRGRYLQRLTASREIESVIGAGHAPGERLTS